MVIGSCVLIVTKRLKYGVDFSLWFARAIFRYYLAIAVQKEHLGYPAINPKVAHQGTSFPEFSALISFRMYLSKWKLAIGRSQAERWEVVVASITLNSNFSTASQPLVLRRTTRLWKFSWKNYQVRLSGIAEGYATVEYQS